MYKNRLLYYRQKADMTGPELAEKSGVDVSSISRAERGVKDLTGSRWGALADVLECTVDELLDRQ